MLYYFGMKNWIVREQITEEAAKELSAFSKILTPLLFYRGLSTKEKAEEFLNPDFKIGLHDPFLMLGMEKAVDRILKAIQSNERIVVFSDYDADGVSAAAIFYEFFGKIGFENFHIHIGDRQVEGYGLTSEAIKEFVEQKAKLILTFDCGITDYDEVEEINKNKIDIIIIDHHLPPEKLPNAYAIVDNKQNNDPYQFKMLCGAAMAFKTVEALIKKGEFKITEGWEKWLLDMVAIATIADMVDLVGENRILAHYGLQVLRKTKRVGLLALVKRLNLSLKELTEDDIGFMVAPRINISSRMGQRK